MWGIPFIAPTLRQKIIALAIVPLVLAILAITFLVTSQSRELAESAIETFSENAMNAKREELRTYAGLARSAIAPIYQAASRNDEHAKARVREILSSLEWGPDRYFFVYDYTGKSIVHPRQPWRVGMSWYSLIDKDQKPMIAELIDRARHGGGFYTYKWEKPSTGKLADKLSYAFGLNKWGWMVGTGVYIDDVTAQNEQARADIKNNIDHTFVIVSLITLPAVVAVFLTGIFLTLRERHMADRKQKELTQRVIDAQEEERARIARELHDGISQHLVGVRFVLDLALRKVRQGANDAPEAIERGAAALNTTIKEVRRISHDLRPSILDDLGLTAALEGLTHSFSERTGIPVKLTSVPVKNMLPPEVKTALYRVAQEALTNIERHAKASRVEISISLMRGGIRMRISDNGHGFETDYEIGPETHQRGLGLRNMQERVEYFGGYVELDTSEHGTTLIARVPKSAYIRPKKEIENA